MPGVLESSLDERLDAYELSVGFGRTTLVNHDEVQQLLTMPVSDIQKFSSGKISEMAFILSRFSLYLQRTINRLQAKIRWADDLIKRVIASDLARTPGGSFEERRLLAINKSPKATELDQIRLGSQLKLDSLNFLVIRLDHLGRALHECRQGGEPAQEGPRNAGLGPGGSGL